MNIDIEKKKSRFEKADAYKTFVETKAYEVFKREKTEFVEMVKTELLENGLKEDLNLKEKMIEAKVYLKLFADIEGLANKREKLAEELRGLGETVL